MRHRLWQWANEIINVKNDNHTAMHPKLFWTSRVCNMNTRGKKLTFYLTFINLFFKMINPIPMYNVIYPQNNLTNPQLVFANGFISHRFIFILVFSVFGYIIYANPIKNEMCFLTQKTSWISFYERAFEKFVCVRFRHCMEVMLNKIDQIMPSKYGLTTMDFKQRNDFTCMVFPVLILIWLMVEIPTVLCFRIHVVSKYGRLIWKHNHMIFAG